MVEITKAEAKYLREKGIREGIVRTMKQKSKRGNRQLVCEDRFILDLLEEYRASQNIVLTYGKV